MLVSFNKISGNFVNNIPEMRKDYIGRTIINVNKEEDTGLINDFYNKYSFRINYKKFDDSPVLLIVTHNKWKKVIARIQLYPASTSLDLNYGDGDHLFVKPLSMHHYLSKGTLESCPKRIV